MQKAVPETVDADARGQQFAGEGPVRHAHHDLVRPVRNEHAHVHAAQRRQLQRGNNAAVRYEVGAGDPDAAAGRCDNLVVHEAGFLEVAGRVRGEDEDGAVARRVAAEAPLEVDAALRRPAPVRGKGELGAHDSGPREAQVRVAPGAAAAEAQVFIAHVVAADPGADTVDDHDLAVVAEVELEAVAAALGGIEGRQAHPGALQAAVEGRAVEARGADLVVEQVDVHTGRGLAGEDIADPRAEAVIADDVELEQDVALGALQAGHDAAEGGVAVDQQLHPVAAGGREPGEAAQTRVQGQVVARRQEMLAHGGEGVLGEGLGPRLHLRPLLEVAVEAIAAEDQVQRHRDIGQGQQRNHPGNGALGRAHRHHRLDSRADGQQVEEHHGDGDELAVGKGGHGDGSVHRGHRARPPAPAGSFPSFRLHALPHDAGESTGYFTQPCPPGTLTRHAW